jgi:polysaccharide pyruvyl transferase WcaK-like protein
MRRLTVWVEHSAGWGNVGDDALLLSAVARLESHLGPCDFVLPRLGTGQLPDRLPASVVAPSPQSELVRIATRLRSRLRPVLMRRGLADLAIEPRSLATEMRLHEVAAMWLLVQVRCASIGGLRRKKGLAEAFRLLRHCDLVYVVGDNSFNDFYPAGVVGRRWLCELARLAGTPVALSSQGIGPLETRWARRNLARMLRHADFLSVRDHDYGRTRVIETGVGPEPLVAADEALAMPSAPEAEAQRVLQQAGIDPGRPFVAVNFRTTDCIRDTSALAPRLARLLDAVAEQCSAALVFVPMSYGGHWGTDHHYAEQIRLHMTRPSQLKVLPAQLDPAQVKAIAGRARFTLGTSYHLHVFGLAGARPAFVLYTGAYYHAKSHGLASFYPAGARAFDLDAVDDHEILREIEGITRDYDARRDSIEAVNTELLPANTGILRELALRLRPARSDERDRATAVERDLGGRKSRAGVRR